MELIKANSAHYKSQLKYLQYLKNIKVGDTVYPGYDGKGGRCTACKVIDIKDNIISVIGKFWSSEDETVTFIFNEYGETIDENEDYYKLIMFEGFDVNNGYFSDKYLQSLGLK